MRKWKVNNAQLSRIQFTFSSVFDGNTKLFFFSNALSLCFIFALENTVSYFHHAGSGGAQRITRRRTLMED